MVALVTEPPTYNLNLPFCLDLHAEREFEVGFVLALGVP